MARFLSLIAFILCQSSPITTFADTVDVWTVKLNGKVITNSNQTAIVYGKSPMTINLSSLKNNDTLQICYWTDSGLERYKWYYLFKDVNHSEGLIGSDILLGISNVCYNTYRQLLMECCGGLL